MNIIKTALYALIAMITLASCEKEEVNPESPAALTLKVEGLDHSIELNNETDYSDYTLFLPHGTNLELTLETNAAEGIKIITWDVPIYFFNPNDFISTLDFIELNENSTSRMVYTNNEINTSSNYAKGIWAVDTWPDMIVIDGPIPKHLTVHMMDMMLEEFELDIAIQFSDDPEGLIYTP